MQTSHILHSQQVTIAVLAVTTRGYVATITRSSQRQAHKKLAELHRRWEQVNHLLAPVIEGLPEFMALPVLLLVVSLLDQLISSSTPLSAPITLLFVASILSSLCATIAGIYMIWTVLHGLRYNAESPFQSASSRIIMVHVHTIIALLSKSITTPFRSSLSLLAFFQRRTSPTRVPYLDVRVEDSLLPQSLPRDLSQDSYYNNLILTDPEHDVFHTILYHTHDDDILDQAGAAFVSLLTAGHHHGSDFPVPTTLELQSIMFLLSSEASIRCNLTAATAVCRVDWSRGEYLLIRI